MSDVTCLNCGHEFPLRRTYFNENGLHTVCPECGSSFDTDEEVELNDKQSDRCDEVYNAVYEMCKCFTENENLEWDMAYIGEIAEFAANTLVSHGQKVRFPAVVTNQDNSQYIEEYYNLEGECCC